ncbi:hypothetical protein, partial [Mycoplasmopsis bovis]|uniref:hypothetical protein n=1 Tax=Mycoplasmopsis bovis TaxID=28903 RepID=UPI003D2C7312
MLNALFLTLSKLKSTKNIGPKIIESLTEYINNPLNKDLLIYLCTLSNSELILLPRYGEQKVDNILNSIESV